MLFQIYWVLSLGNQAWKCLCASDAAADKQPTSVGCLKGFDLKEAALSYVDLSYLVGKKTICYSFPFHRDTYLKALKIIVVNFIRKHILLPTPLMIQGRKQNDSVQKQSHYCAILPCL